MLFAGLFLPGRCAPRTANGSPRPASKVAATDTAIMVTAASRSHALTLSLAATGFFSADRMIEFGVAASVMFAGLNNSADGKLGIVLLGPGSPSSTAPPLPAR
jgi:hypothetical protein